MQLKCLMQSAKTANVCLASSVRTAACPLLARALRRCCAIGQVRNPMAVKDGKSREEVGEPTCGTRAHSTGTKREDTVGSGCESGCSLYCI